MKPQFEQNIVERPAPMTQITSAMSFRGILAPCGVSIKTVIHASIKAKAESIPSVNIISASKNTHKFELCCMSNAVGIAMNAKSIELVFSATGEPMPLKYPRVEKTAKPAIKLINESPKATLIASPMIGLFVLL